MHLLGPVPALGFLVHDPTVSAGADETINEGVTFTRSGSFTDPGTADAWTATVDYGEGAGVETLLIGDSLNDVQAARAGAFDET